MENHIENKIKTDSYNTFKDDIRNIDGIQWIPVTDAKAAIGFAITNTIEALIKNKEKTYAASHTLDIVYETLKRSNKEGLQSEVFVFVFAFAFIALKNNPLISIAEALEYGLKEWDF